jgi:hypothetical protein
MQRGLVAEKIVPRFALITCTEVYVFYQEKAILRPCPSLHGGLTTVEAILKSALR